MSYFLINYLVIQKKKKKKKKKSLLLLFLSKKKQYLVNNYGETLYLVFNVQYLFIIKDT